MTLTPTWSVPPNTPPGECRSCRKRVFWITTANHKPMPVDCAVPGGREPTPSEKGIHAGLHGLGVSHFATCPHANDWRKDRK